MVVVIQVIYRILTSAKRIQQVKPFTLHCSLLLLIFVYAFIGGLVFNRLESEATMEHHRREWQTRADCVYQTLEHAKEPLGEPFWPLNVTAEHILKCFKTEPDHRSQWSLVTATLYGFGIVTTLGYNRIAPITLAGRLFCVFYGICGIPMTMIIIANIGQYLNQFAGAARKNIEAYRERRRRSRNTSITEEDISDSSIEFMSLGLLIAFLLYVCFGAILLPLLNGELDFFNGIYFNFLCLTAIDFGQLVPSRWAYLPITFLYVCIGLAITTIAIEIGSEYLKKLHHFGKKMKNVAQTRIWFGGKTLRVKDLLHAVGKKCGIDPAEIDKLDLENVVERAVAFNEGREPPPDTNEEDQELPPKEPQPPAEEEKPLIDKEEPKRPRTPPMKRAAQRFMSGPSAELAMPLADCEGKGGGKSGGKDLCLDMCEFVAIDMDVPEPAEQALPWMQAPKRTMRTNEEMVEPDPDFVSPGDLTANGPPKVIVGEDHRIMDMEPRKFKEKKEKYGRDAKKLYETYQEEWDRLERLSDQRLGPRRKSVLALNTGGRGRESSLEGPSSISPTPSAHSHQGGIANANNNNQQQKQQNNEGPSKVVEAVVTSPPPWRRPSNVYSPPPWRKVVENKSKDQANLRASASPQVLRPPEREDRERRSSSPRKLSFTKFSKFGEMVKKPQVPGLEERLEERRKSRISGELSLTPEASRKSLTPATPGSAKKIAPSTPTFTNRRQ